MNDFKTYPLPFQVYVESIYRIASIEFYASKQELYTAYEVHYVRDLNKESGYLLYCRKKDRSFDLYMEKNLVIPLEKVSQMKDNLVEIFPITFKHILFEIREEQLFLSFQFVDKRNLMHSVELVEGTTQKTHPIDMLSSFGNTLQKPTFFPLFYLYDFDFLRKRKARIKIEIGEKRYKSKGAIPGMFKDGKKRQWIRYAKSTQMIELFGSSYSRLVEEPVTNLQIRKNPVTYCFSNEAEFCLEKIEIDSNPQGTNIVFDPAIPNIKKWKEQELDGIICITGAHQAGVLSGEYKLTKEEDTVHFHLQFVNGYKKSKKTLLDRTLFQKNATFSSWPKSYQYISKIDVKTMDVESKWIRNK